MAEHILDLPAPLADIHLPYGTEELQFGDLRLPPGRGPHPVAVVIHGGFWRAQYDLTHIGHLCAALTAAGIATWNVEYRRIGNPGGGWPGTFHDVASATDYLRDLALSYGLDLARVVTVGHSAGGHLALWLGARHRLPPDAKPYTPEPLPLRAAVALAGVSDLVLAWELRLRDGIVRKLLSGTPEEMPERYHLASPAALLPLGLSQTLIHGMSDESVPSMMSERYASKALEAGDHVTLLTLPGADHFTLIDPRSPEWPEVRAAIMRALD
jgi:acetyl esterase/lipase